MDLLVIILVKLIILDKLCGGVPIKVVEHFVIKSALSLAWWSATSILYGIGYIAYLPFKSNKQNTHPAINNEKLIPGNLNCKLGITAFSETSVLLNQYNEQLQKDDDSWELITLD